LAETLYTINLTGQDYDDLSAFDVGEAADITAGNAKVAVVYSDDGDLADSVVFSGGDWTTDADSYVGVRGATHHDGTPGTGPVLMSDGAVPILTSVDYLNIEWMEIHGNGNGVNLIDATNVTAGSINVSYCLLHDTTEYALELATATPGTMENCGIWDVDRGIYIGGANAVYLAYHNTVLGDGDFGIMRLEAWNNYVGEFSTDFLQLDAASDYNVSSDDTADDPGNGHDQINKNAYATYFEDINDGSEDLHLTDTGANLWGSGGLDVGVTDDIDGDTRTRPDQGFDEFIR